MYNLPRGYLSYSAMTLWLKDREGFRAKYYVPDTPSFSTPYTEFGKKIATMLETGEHKTDPVLSRIPKYKVSEYAIEHTVAGVPIKAYIDSFDPKKKRILEYKTSINNKTWNKVSVQKHDQLLLYHLLVKETLGEVHPVVTLVSIQTAWSEEKKGGLLKRDEGRSLYLTGEFEVFKRTIKDWEHDYMRDLIVKVATEVSLDFSTRSI
jgi:hypothetical protein